MKKIEFYPSSTFADQVVPPPKPAKSYIPDWYKSLRAIDGPPIFQNGLIKNLTVKSCMPYLDAMTSGYIQETWCDIHISVDNGEVSFNYPHGPEIIRIRKEIGRKIPDRFHQIEFTWVMPWYPRVDNGYSCLFVSPLNNSFLPFVNTAGIIDSDSFYTNNPGNYPFYIYKDFSGIIPCGTPMYQIIPIKRDSWQSSQKEYDHKKVTETGYQIRKIFSGGYKKFFHKKKSYN
jgi:hypothetical protein